MTLAVHDLEDLDAIKQTLDTSTEALVIRTRVPPDIMETMVRERNFRLVTIIGSTADQGNPKKVLMFVCEPETPDL